MKLIFLGTALKHHPLSVFYFLPLQVHESAGDERPRAVRPDEHHERGHAEQVPAGGMDQARVLPTLILLLSLRVMRSQKSTFREHFILLESQVTNCITHVRVIFLSA